MCVGIAERDLPGAAVVMRTYASIGETRDPDMIMWYTDFRSDLDVTSLLALPPRLTPVITWEPFDSSGGTEQPDFRLDKILSGSFDSYIEKWARDVSSVGRRVFVRFAHEQNGDWYPWSEQRNGNRAGDYVRTWRHVQAIFDRVGVDNVEWMWSPNVDYEGATALADVYPGDSAVDVVGIDGYNWGTSQPGKSWQIPAEVFEATVNQVHDLSDRPIILSEVGSTELGGDKATWIKQLGHYFEQTPEITGFIWFDYNKETDWRIASSEASRAAFLQVLAALPRSCPTGVSN
ncbi:glycosyl hydrolase [Rhodococcus sp. IEGM 1409]|uniref:glycoside hydrolase family 26 protein n=1 Tax=Rhodococcus sp. IEGM 1409 TaxID=3047082 RepID=UPI0024B7B07F|nr:glycosyl hydrolase [Rhodococcus sp. IEGM 1409]MDI9901125.1 glycosyl hydrolase [Rhodococcus sp. IEGM 1409]